MYEILRFRRVPKTGGLVYEATSSSGTYRITEVRNRVFQVRRNGRLIHTAGYPDAAAGQAQIDSDERARKMVRR